MYRICLYKDKSGREPFLDYLRGLSERTDKESRIKLNKILQHIRLLGEYGLQLREPYAKHLDGEIWELRPVRERVLFAAWGDDGFVLLHSFTKKTRKTPAREIAQAKRELADFAERSAEDEQE